MAALINRHAYGAGWISAGGCILFAGVSAAMTGAATGFAIAGSDGAQMLGSVAGVLIPAALIVFELTRRA